MNKIISSLIIFLYLNTTTVIYAQKFFVVNKLSEYSAIHYPEKIYIQTDKPYYTAGEDIWFSTYLLNGVTHKKSEKSKVIYVELIDAKDSIISSQKLFTESKNVASEFKIPIDVTGGAYIIRAYTTYMRNQPIDYFFNKDIQIFGFTEIVSTTKQVENFETTELPDIGFYPEGGYLVNGLRTKIAVKIKDADLNANPVSGNIEDDQGNTVAQFKTSAFGLAYFEFMPEKGRKYHAVITSGDEAIIYELPEPLLEGYILNCMVTKDDVIINVTTNKELGLKNTFIIGQQRGMIAFDFVNEKVTNTLTLKIAKTDLVAGVLDIVLFNETNSPVAERLLFIEDADQLTVSVKKTNGTTIGIRDKVNLDLEIKDKTGRLVASTLSISITDATVINQNEYAENIKTNLLLNSDLRGKVKSPNYFFQDGDENKKIALLDLIMMTHGWSRFTWQDFIKNSGRQEFEPEDGIYIEGFTKKAKSPYNFKACETKLTIRKNGFYQETQKTDTSGHFSFGPFAYTEEVDVFLQAGEQISTEKPDFKNTNIVLNLPIQKPRIISLNRETSFTQKLKNLQVYTKKVKSNVVQKYGFDTDRELLKEVTLRKTVQTEEEIKEIGREKRTRFFKPSHRIVVGDFGLAGGGDFLELVVNIPGVRIGKKYGAQASQDIVLTLRGLDPSYYLDDIKIDLPTARMIKQADIDFIDVLNVGQASAAYGLESQGIIAIYRKQGNRENVKITDRKPGSISFKSEGFYNAREFYAPDYSLVDRNSEKPDKRTTLYWNPKIITRGFSNAQLTFYTADDDGKFQIEIEGITDTGIPFYNTILLGPE